MDVGVLSLKGWRVKQVAVRWEASKLVIWEGSLWAHWAWERLSSEPGVFHLTRRVRHPLWRDVVDVSGLSFDDLEIVDIEGPLVVEVLIFSASSHYLVPVEIELRDPLDLRQIVSITGEWVVSWGRKLADHGPLVWLRILWSGWLGHAWPVRVYLLFIYVSEIIEVIKLLLESLVEQRKDMLRKVWAPND
jgi:hypothetical protein